MTHIDHPTTHDAGVPPAPPEAHQRAEIVTCDLCLHAGWLPGGEAVICRADPANCVARGACKERVCDRFEPRPAPTDWETGPIVREE
jgi:hypothetical protein